MNPNLHFREPTHRGATRRKGPRALTWFLATVGLALAAAFFSPAVGMHQSSAVKPVALTTSR